MKDTFTASEIMETYYEKVTMVSVDRRIRETVQKVANEVADQIIANYSLKNLVIKEIEERTDATSPKIFVAVELERINDEIPSSTK